jgi:hypothetical protein
MSGFASPQDGRPADAPAAKRRKPRTRHAVTYRSTSFVDRLDTRHHGLRAMVENLLRRRFPHAEIAQRVSEHFGVKVSRPSISRFWAAQVRPELGAETAAYRQAHAQARALLEEMKADPSLDAVQIAELMLAAQIFRDHSKLAEADILDLYKEQRERQKLELQSRELRLRERQAKRALAKTKTSKPAPGSARITDEAYQKILEIYGLNDEPEPAPAPAEPPPGAALP